MYNYYGRKEPFLIIYIQLSFVITSKPVSSWCPHPCVKDPRRGGGNIWGILPWPEITNCSLLRIKLCDRTRDRDTSTRGLSN